MAAVQAIKALEQIADQADANVRHPGAQLLPGLIIVVNNGTAAPRFIDAPAMPVIEGHRTQRVDV